jgi:uncharacterized protein YciI
MEWQLDAHRAGRILFSGPTADRVYGVYVLLAADRREAEQLASKDPYHRAGVRSMEVLEWEVEQAMRLEGPTISEVEAMARGAAT